MRRATTRSPASPDLLTTMEAAADLGNISAEQISRWCLAGIIKGAIRLPGNAGWRIHRKSWEKWKRGRTPKAARLPLNAQPEEAGE